MFFVGVAAAALVLPVGDPAAADDLEFEGYTRYEVDTAARVVRVTHDAVVTNNKPDQGNAFFLYPEFSVPVLPEATRVSATRADGLALPVRMVPRGDFTEAVVDLVPDLRHRETIRFRLDYALPDLGPRASGYTRVTPALTTFVAFAYGSPGRARFEVRAPTGLEVETAGADLERTIEGDVQVFSSGPLDDPAASFTTVSARDEAQLLTRSFSIDGRAIAIRAWPDDPEWAAFTEEQLRSGIPVLEPLVGLPWPVEGELTVAESASPFVYGYAGWFLPASDTIEVGDAFDGQVLLHEVSHLWFNARLLAERWMSEGFAEVFAKATLDELGAPTLAAPGLAADAPRFPLAQWPSPLPEAAVTDADVAADESYGYAQSFAVAQVVTDAIGIAGVRDVLEASHDRELTYRGDGEVEDFEGATTSRRLLDLIENTGAPGMTELFSRLVLDPLDRDRLQSRAATRDEYARLVAAGEGWSAPYPVRLAMAQWEFERAGARMEDAREILATRDELEQRADALDLGLPPTLETDYETAARLEEVAADVRRLVDATALISVATERVDDSRNLLETIGLFGTDPDDALDSAKHAFTDGDADAATNQAQRAITKVEGAANAGAQRLAMAVGVALLLALLVCGARRRRRRRRTRSGPARPPFEDVESTGVAAG
jgi:hypothetical protein